MADDDDNGPFDELPEGARLLFAGKNETGCRTDRPCFHCLIVQLVGSLGKEFNVPLGDAAGELLHALAAVMAMIEAKDKRAELVVLLQGRLPELVEAVHEKMQFSASKEAQKH